MEPEVFLEQKDVVPLTRVLIQVLMQNNTASDRYSLLDNAGINAALIGNLRLDSQPNVLAQALVAEFRRYRVDSRWPDYHPMVNLLAHLCEFAQMYHLSDQDITLFRRLVKQGQENFKTFKNTNTVDSTQDTDTVSIQGQQRDRVFISYSHKDKAWLNRLQTMLKPLVREQRISVWDDTQIPAGSLWKDEINKALAAAKVAVLMVSADFLASDFIAKHELPPLLLAAEHKGVKIIWVYLSACMYEETEIAAYQAAHDISQPLDSLSLAEQNQVLVNICQKIKTVANEPSQKIDTGNKIFNQKNTFKPPGLEDVNWQCTHTITVRSGGFFSTTFSAAVNTIIFSNDGKTLFSASEDWNEPIKLWNASTGQEIRLIGSWKLGRFATIAISPNGEILVIGGTIIELWNLANQQKIGELGSLIGHRDMAALAISADNHILASSSLGESPFNFRDYSIKLWKLDTKKNICTLNGHSARVNSLAFSPDGQTLASGSKDSKIKVWNLNTLKETYTLTGHQGAVNSIQFSDDNQILASAGEDGQIKIWNPRTGELVHNFMGHSQAILSLAISPDNSIIASASQDSYVKLWSLKKMQEICNLDGHSGSVCSVAFSPNGKIIATGGQDSKIKIWQPSL